MAIRLNQNHLSTLERLPVGAKVMKSCPCEGRVIVFHTWTNCHVKERAREAHHSAWEHMDPPSLEPSSWTMDRLRFGALQRVKPGVQQALILITRFPVCRTTCKWSA